MRFKNVESASKSSIKLTRLITLLYSRYDEERENFNFDIMAAKDYRIPYGHFLQVTKLYL